MEELIIRIKKSDAKAIGFPFSVNCLQGDFRIIIDEPLIQKICNLDDVFAENRLRIETPDIAKIGKGLYKALFFGKDGQNAPLLELCGQLSNKGNFRIGLNIDQDASLPGRDYPLANLPWEAMSSAWCGQTFIPSIVRYFPEKPYPFFPITVKPPLRIYMIIFDVIFRTKTIKIKLVHGQKNLNHQRSKISIKTFHLKLPFAFHAPIY